MNLFWRFPPDANRFKFRVDYDAEAGGKVLLNENDVETVVLMSRVKD